MDAVVRVVPAPVSRDRSPRQFSVATRIAPKRKRLPKEAYLDPGLLAMAGWRGTRYWLANAGELRGAKFSWMSRALQE